MVRVSCPGPVASATGAWFCGFESARRHATQSRCTPGVAPAYRFDMTIQILVFFGGLVALAAFACLPVFVIGRQISRWEGGVFMGCYLACTAYVALTAQQHAALPAFGTAMLSFVLPLTAVTLVVVMLRPAPPAHTRRS